MARQTIPGRLAKLDVSLDGELWHPVSLIVDVGMSISVDELETTTHASGGRRSYIPGHTDFTLEVSAYYLDGDPGQDLLHDNVDSSTLCRFRYSLETAAGRPQWEGLCFLRSAQLAGPLEGVAGFSTTLRCSKVYSVRQPVPAEPVVEPEPEAIPPLPAPYLYWSMDAAEITGNSVASLPVGSGMAAVYGAGPDFGPGEKVSSVAGSLSGKTGLAFDGTVNSDLRLPATITLGTGDFTILGHVFIPIGAGFGFNFASWESADGGHQVTFGCGPGGVNFAVGTTFANGVGGNLGTPAVAEGAWADVGVVVRRATTATGWLDGAAGGAPLDVSTLAGLDFTFPNTSAAWPRFGARVGSPIAPFADFRNAMSLAEWVVIKSALTDDEMERFHALRLEGTSVKENQGY